MCLHCTYSFNHKICGLISTTEWCQFKIISSRKISREQCFIHILYKYWASNHSVKSVIHKHFFTLLLINFKNLYILVSVQAAEFRTLIFPNILQFEICSGFTACFIFKITVQLEIYLGSTCQSIAKNVIRKEINTLVFT